MLAAFLAPSILIVMSLIAFALNQDIAGLISGVDQITNYPAYATATAVNHMNLAAHIAFAMTCMVRIAWKPLGIIHGPLFTTAILLASSLMLASIYASYVDNGDMYPHANGGRLLVNGATYVLIFLAAGTSRSTIAR